MSRFGWISSVSTTGMRVALWLASSVAVSLAITKMPSGPSHEGIETFAMSLRVGPSGKSPVDKRGKYESYGMDAGR